MQMAAHLKVTSKKVYQKMVLSCTQTGANMSVISDKPNQREMVNGGIISDVLKDSSLPVSLSMAL